MLWKLKATLIMGLIIFTYVTLILGRKKYFVYLFEMTVFLVTPFKYIGYKSS